MRHNLSNKVLLVSTDLALVVPNSTIFPFSGYSSACFGGHELGGIAVNKKYHITRVVSYVCVRKGVDVVHEALRFFIGVLSRLCLL